nr:hypothetical protein [Tanacetum cinerariifolium]
MNYLEEQTDGEAMINSIQNGAHPLPVVAQVSLAGTTPNAIPTLKDPKFWTAKEKKNRKIDRLARSLLIQRLPNDIYSLIDSNDTSKDLWDALERQMRGSEYGEQDMKAAILYEYETFKAIEGEQLLDTYLRYLHVINELKKCGYKKDNYELNASVEEKDSLVQGILRLDSESPKIVTSRNMVFNKSVMYKDTLKDSDAGLDKSVEELQVEVELHGLNNHTFKKDHRDEEDGDDEDAGDQETDQTPDLTDYRLVWDREPRTRMKPLSCYERIDRFYEEEQDLRVSRSSSWENLIRHTSIRVIFALTACKDYELEQLDVKTVFLHDNLEEVIDMRQPPRYEQGNKSEIGSTKTFLKKEFDMKELDKAKKILGMEIIRDQIRKILRVSQSWMSKVSYANEVRSLMANMSLVYGRDHGNHVDIIVFVDSDYAKDPDKAHCGSFNYKGEVMAFTKAVKEAIWLRGLLEELGVELSIVAVNCDNQSAIHLSRNHVFS